MITSGTNLAGQVVPHSLVTKPLPIFLAKIGKHGVHFYDDGD